MNFSIKILFIFTLTWAHHSIAADVYPVVPLLQKLKNLTSQDLSQDRAYELAEKMLGEYRKTVDHTAGWKLSKNTSDLLISFPGASTYAGLFAGPMGDMFNTKYNYSFVALNFSCNLPKQNLPCRLDHWRTDIEFAVEIAKLLKKRISFLGFSAGGAIATYAAYLFPDRTEKLFLIAPALKPRYAEIGLNIASFACLNHRIGNINIRVVKTLKENFSDAVINLTCELNRLYKKQRSEKSRRDFYRSIQAKTYLVKVDKDSFVDNREIDALKESLPNLERFYSYPDSINHAFLPMLMDDVFANSPVTYKEFVSQRRDLFLTNPELLKAFHQEKDGANEPLVPILFDSWLGGESVQTLFPMPKPL